jgi:hypothetical protein
MHKIHRLPAGVSASMCRAVRPILTFVAVLLAIAGVTACGGGTSGEVVAQVGGSSITKAQLSHWMSTLAGGDFYDLSAGHTVPVGLASEPPNEAACVARLEAAAASPAGGRSKPAAAQLLSKCRLLYQALKRQAAGFLVESQWLIGLDGEEGVTATNGEVMQLFKHVKAEQFPREGELQRYLADNRRNLSDELFILKLDVLRQKTQQKIEAGGKRVLAEFTEAGRRLTLKTSCRAGYVVRHCKQYAGPPAPFYHTSPAVLLEQVAAITGRPCVNRLACG